MESLNKIFDRFKSHADIARGIITLLKSMSSYGLNRTFFFDYTYVWLYDLDDAIDEMISTKIDQSLLYEIKRFHSDNDVSWILLFSNIRSIDVPGYRWRLWTADVAYSTT